MRLKVLAPPPLVYLAGLGAGLALDRLAPLPWPAAFPSVLVGSVLVALGVVLLALAAAALHRHRTTINPYGRPTTLVQEGPYAVSRNPIYVADVLIYVGVAVTAGSLWSLVLLPAVLGVMSVGVIQREERYLAEHFGAEYEAYRSKVRRWM